MTGVRVMGMMMGMVVGVMEVRMTEVRVTSSSSPFMGISSICVE